MWYMLQAVDVEEFASKHPGGAHMIDLCVGRDATILFESSHLRNKVTDAVLEKLPAPSAEQLRAAGVDMTTPEMSAESFCTPGRSDFYCTLRERVLNEVVLPRSGRGAGPGGSGARGVPAWHIAAVLVSWALSAMLFIHSPSWQSGLLLGFTMAWIGERVAPACTRAGLPSSASLHPPPAVLTVRSRDACPQAPACSTPPTTVACAARRG